MKRTQKLRQHEHFVQGLQKNLSFRLSSEPNVIRQGRSLKDENLLNTISWFLDHTPPLASILLKSIGIFGKMMWVIKKVAKAFSSNAVILNPTKQSSYIPSK